MVRDDTLFEGKTLDDAVRKGLAALGLSRAEVMITVVEEGSGGFLGLGARPYRVRVAPRPGGAIREPDARDRDERRGGRGGPGRGRDRDRRGGRGERAPRDRGARAERSGGSDRGGRPDRGERAGRSGGGGGGGGVGSGGGERGERGGRGGGRFEGGRREEPAREPREARGGERPPRHERPQPERAPLQVVPGAGGQGGQEDDGRRRRRRRRGRGPGGREDRAPAPPTSAPAMPANPVATRTMEDDHEPAAVSSGPLMPVDQLEGEAVRLTQELLSRMGFDATVSAQGDGERVDVRAVVPDGGDDLTGRKGEVRQALQHLLNRMLNRGGSSTYHLQLEINDFWEKREGELADLAKRLADEAVTSNSEAVTEYLNAQERRIVHVTLKTDSRVKTYALGTGLIKRVAVAPADFPERSAGEE